MKLSVQPIFGNTLLCLPSIIVMDNDDPEYTQYNSVVFIGWLCFGLHIFFGKKDTAVCDAEYFTVSTISNNYLDQHMYIGKSGDNLLLAPIHFDCLHDIAYRTSDGKWNFLAKCLVQLTADERKAIYRSKLLSDKDLYSVPFLAWEDDRDATTVCYLINCVIAAESNNHWHVLYIPTPSHVLN